MSKRFPAATYRDMARVAKQLGFYFARQAKGSHEVWRRDRDGRQTTIPNHGTKSLKRKTVKAILRNFGISASEFMRLLHK